MFQSIFISCKSLEECPVEAVNEIQQILSTINNEPESIQQLMQCCSRNLFFICSYVQQTCVIDRTNNQIKSSPPCQEVIDRMMLDPDCKVSFKFLMKIHRMHKLCWSLFTGKRLNLTAYPRKDIQHMESCQMNNKGLFHFIFIKK